MLEPGDRVGRYEIQAIIGEGGFGKVYRAYDPKLERAVAVKELLGERKAARDASALPSPAAGLRRGIPVDPRSRHKSAKCVPGTLARARQRSADGLPGTTYPQVASPLPSCLATCGKAFRRAWSRVINSTPRSLASTTNSQS